jgi:hypothetical protein
LGGSGLLDPHELLHVSQEVSRNVVNIVTTILDPEVCPMVWCAAGVMLTPGGMVRDRRPRKIDRTHLRYARRAAAAGSTGMTYS